MRKSVWEKKAQPQFLNNSTLYSHEDVLIQTNKWSAITMIIMITVDGVFFVLPFNSSFCFSTDIKTKCLLAFFFYSEHLKIGKKMTKWKKAHIHHFDFRSVELSSAILIALTTDRIVCVFKRVQHARTLHTVPRINSIEKFSNNGIFNNRWNFIQKPKRYNSSVTQ